MKFDRYAQYAKTGAVWIARIPSHWECKVGRRYFEQRRQPAGVDDEQLSVTQKYGVVPQTQFMEAEDQKVVLALKGVDNFKHVERGDFVISLRSFQGGIEGSDHVGCVSPAYTVLRAKRPIHDHYWRLLFKSVGFISALEAATEGIREGKSISYDQFAQIPLPFPPFEEQVIIARFLNREVERIAALIAQQERLITLLSEKRQAVISDAVTKGLNAGVPTKSCRVEWLSEAPAHWGVTRLKYSTDLIVDCPHETPTYDADGEYLVVRTADIEDGVLDPRDMYRLSQEQYQMRTRRQTLIAGDIVYSREGERWGHAAIVSESNRYCLGQRMMQIRAASGVDPEFLMWQLNSDGVRQQGEADTLGATSPHVNVGTIRNFQFAQPELDEQREVAAFVGQQTKTFDDLVAESRRAIALLNERRAALVCEAVTGQIDLREPTLAVVA